MSSNVCTPEERKGCEKQFPDHIEWACSVCEKNRTKESDTVPYTLHLLRLHRLVRAGFPFSQDDLPLETWEDVALIRDLLEARRLSAILPGVDDGE